MENKITEEEMKNECLSRLNDLKRYGTVAGAKFIKPAIEVFKNGDIGIYEHQNAMFKSVYYNLYMNKGSEPYDTIINEKELFELRTGAKVFLIQLTHTSFGTCASMFYVSPYKEDWSSERTSLMSNNYYCYVANLDDDTCSESGLIGFAFDRGCGGIYRTA